MARIKLTLSANAGGALQLGSHRLLIDALHNGKIPGFSTLDANLRERVLNHTDFANPELICVTHNHPDHHCASLTEKALVAWPDTRLCLPEDATEVSCGDLRLSYIPLTHDGKEFVSISHFGILIRWQGRSILIPGDCAVADEALLQAVDGITIDLAILNFPWLTLRKGRECLQKLLQPKKCIFWHMPFAEDDINGYRLSAEAALNHYPGILLYNPLQTIELDI